MITSLSEYDIYAGGKNKRSDFYGISTSSWKPWRWMKLDLIFMMRDKSIPAWTHPENSVPAAETPSLMISSHGASLRWSQRPFQSAWEYSWAIQWKETSPFEFEGGSMETWIDFPMEGMPV